MPSDRLPAAAEAAIRLPFHPDDRLAIFIDGANTHAAARALGFDIDYRKMLLFLADESRLIRASYYTSTHAETDDAGGGGGGGHHQNAPSLRPMLDWLDYNGFRIVTRTTREFVDAAGRKKIKGGIEVDLAVDMVRMAKTLDHVILMSGNGDYRPAIEAIQENGPKTTVISTFAAKPPMISDDLRRQADFFIELADLETILGRDAAELRPENRTKRNRSENFSEFDNF